MNDVKQETVLCNEPGQHHQGQNTTAGSLTRPETNRTLSIYMLVQAELNDVSLYYS